MTLGGMGLGGMTFGWMTLANILGPDLLIVVFLAFSFALPIAAVIDAAGRPSGAWESAGQSKLLWIVLCLAGIVIPFGFVVAIVYLAAIRPKVTVAQR